MLRISTGRGEAESIMRFGEVPGSGGREGGQAPARVFYRAGFDSGDLVMEDRKEGADCLLNSQASVSSGFPGRECWWLKQRDCVRQEDWVCQERVSLFFFFKDTDIP